MIMRERPKRPKTRALIRVRASYGYERSMAMQESQIERRLAQGVKAKGGMCMKFTSPGLPGVPDRIVLLPDGRVIFIELKTKSGRLAAVQRWVISAMRARGADVRVLHGLDQVKSFLEEVTPNEV